VIVEVTGDEQKVDGLEELLRPRGIEEMVRTGQVALVRGVHAATGIQEAGSSAREKLA
jgi:acetolactate synthase-1/3 small subunit